MGDKGVEMFPDIRNAETVKKCFAIEAVTMAFKYNVELEMFECSGG
jgi:hypothetical protein